MNKTTRKLLRCSHSNAYPLLLDADLNYIPSKAMWYTDTYDYWSGYTIKRTLNRNDIAYVITKEHVSTLEAYHDIYDIALRFSNGIFDFFIPHADFRHLVPGTALHQLVRYRSTAEDGYNERMDVSTAIQVIKMQSIASSLSKAFSSNWWSY